MLEFFRFVDQGCISLVGLIEGYVQVAHSTEFMGLLPRYPEMVGQKFPSRLRGKLERINETSI